MTVRSPATASFFSPYWGASWRMSPPWTKAMISPLKANMYPLSLGVNWNRSVARNASVNSMPLKATR